ncbi:MAG: hypothetical protein K6T75_07845 [Acetobacteraceae bacterium]|nr:hypothetical protein [Acetobacteraceae bacterium]
MRAVTGAGSASPNPEGNVAALFADLARRYGPQGSDLVWRQFDRLSARFQGLDLVEVAGGQDEEFSLRLAEGGQLRFVSATSPEALAEAARAAAAVSGGSLAVPPGAAPPGSLEDPADPSIRALTADEVVGLGQEILTRLEREAGRPGAVDAGAGRGVTLALERDIVTTHYLSPRGSGRFTATRLGVFLTVTVGEVTLGVEWERGRGMPDPAALARRAARGLECAAGPPAALCLDGPVPVVLAGQAVAPVVAALLQAFNGRHVVERLSPMGQWLGQKGFSRCLSLYDDPAADGVRGRLFDDEGVRCRRTSLISDGVIAGFYFDRASAAMAGTRSTGHGIGARGRPPEPRPTNVVIRAGTQSLRSLMEGLPLAMVAEHAIGDVSPGGDFGLVVERGYLAREGRAVGPVRGVEIRGNLYQALGAVRGLTREREWVGGWLLTPALCVEGLEILSAARGGWGE